MRLERNELQALVAVVETGGFKKAADRLGLSQSAISQSLAGLENKLDTQLLSRGRGAELTRTGRRVYDYAVQIESGEQQVLQDVVSLRRGMRPPLRIALNNFVSRYFAGELIEASNEANPDLIVNASVMPSRQIIGAVLSGQAELGFGPFQTHMQAFTTRVLMQVRHSLTIGQAHPKFAAVMVGDQRALASCRLIVSYLDEPQERPGQQRIRDFFDTVWRVNSLALRIELIRRGLGVGFLNEPILGDLSVDKQLHRVTGVSFAQFDRELGLFHQQHTPLSPPANDFIELCQRRWSSPEPE